MLHKIHIRKISSSNSVNHLTKPVPFTEKRLWRSEPGIKEDLNKWNTKFRLEYSVQKNRTNFSDVPLLPETFCWNDPKTRVPLTLHLGFPETFRKWYENQCLRNVCRNSILVRYHHQDLCRASNWMKQIFNKLEALAPSVWNFWKESNGGIVKYQLVSQAGVGVAWGTPMWKGLGCLSYRLGE